MCNDNKGFLLNLCSGGIISHKHDANNHSMAYKSGQYNDKISRSQKRTYGLVTITISSPYKPRAIFVHLTKIAIIKSKSVGPLPHITCLLLLLRRRNN